MRKLLVVALSAAALITSGSLLASATTADTTTTVTNGDEAPEIVPCQSKQSTGLVKSACKKGGQKAAKKAMKSWVKKVKKAKKLKDAGYKLTCKACHSSLKGAYPLKPNGLADFKKLAAWLAANK
jgi:hypothetical protein